MKAVLASGNANKLRELRSALPRVELVLRRLAAPPGEDPALTWRLFCAALYLLSLDGDDDA